MGIIHRFNSHYDHYEDVPDISIKQPEFIWRVSVFGCFFFVDLKGVVIFHLDGHVIQFAKKYHGDHLNTARLGQDNGKTTIQSKNQSKEPYQRTPKEVARAIRYSGLGVRGPWVLLEISWNHLKIYHSPITKWFLFRFSMSV